MAASRGKAASQGAKKPTKRPARFQLRAIGVIRSTLKARKDAPRQGWEGGPDAWLEVDRSVAEGLDGIEVGDNLVILTWLHQGVRDVLKVRRRRYDDPRLWGVFATRSPDRPNPIGIHPVTVRKVVGNRLLIGPIEAIDKTPVVDIKPEFGPPKKKGARRAKR